MSAFFALLPGLREIRAPLVAGYIWLVVGWLCLGSSLPSRETNATYGQLWVLIDAVGPIGAAVIASMAAYLIGSLVQSVMWGARRILMRLLAFRFLGRSREAHQYSVPAQKDWKWPSWGDVVPVAEIDYLITADLRPDLRWPLFLVLPAKRLEETWQFTIERAVEEPRRWISRAVKRAAEAQGATARVRYNRDGQRYVLEVPKSGVGPVPHLLPIAPAGSIAISMDALELISRRSWDRLEHLNAEMAFREAIAVPLCVLVFVLALQIGAAWMAGLLLPIALLAQRSSLLMHAAWLSLEVVRRSTGTEDLERIAPQISRYRSDAKALAEALDDADWTSYSFPDTAERADASAVR